ncbi:hypothetical protein TcasGA2_TC034562 [Tribolium castaneum]|uniref:Neuropeptide-like 4 n=1 Tax=Tribolium castaneum TaxID=7070 RepID=A0A139WMN9_TRICA|nr:hypothetical protein TcasGA2_TC034562 [Tribolium castaneum]
MKCLRTILLLFITLATVCIAVPVPKPQWVYPSYGYVPSYYSSSYYTAPLYSYGYAYTSPYVYSYY